MIRQGAYEGIVLDVMLPDANGVALCRQLRQRGLTTPIILLTSLGEVRDKVAGFDAGADDYLVKPFDIRELIARLGALLRRGASRSIDRLMAGDISLDRGARTVERRGRPVDLRAKEFALPEYFLQHPGRVLTRDDIGRNVCDMNFESSSNVIDVYVSTLRKKLGDPPVIHTRINAGYVFRATTARCGDERGG